MSYLLKNRKPSITDGALRNNFIVGYHSYLAPFSTRGGASRTPSQAEPRKEGKKHFIHNIFSGF